MADILDTIIELNKAIVANDLDEAESCVISINNNYDSLIERLENAEDIGNYFGIYSTIQSCQNEVSLYVLEHLKGLNEETIKSKIIWMIKVFLKSKEDKETIKAFLDEILAAPVEVYQIGGIIRLINIIQDYSLFNKIQRSDN